MTLEMKLNETRYEGIATGEKRGVMQGSQQKALETAKNFLNMNVLTVEQIAQGTGLSVEEVNALKNTTE